MDLGLRQHRLQNLPILRHDVAMRRAIAVPGKHGMADLMFELKEAEIRPESIPVNMHQGKTAKKHLKDKG